MKVNKDSNTNLSGTTVLEIRILILSLLLSPNPTLLPLNSTEDLSLLAETTCSRFVLSTLVELVNSLLLRSNQSISNQPLPQNLLLRKELLMKNADSISIGKNQPMEDRQSQITIS